MFTNYTTRANAIKGALENILNKAKNNQPVSGSQKIEEYSAVAGNINLFTDLQGSLEQCFLNCIARKNMVQQIYNKGANYGNLEFRGGPDQLTSKPQRRTAIINSLTNILNKAKKDKYGLAKYVLTAYVDAAKNYYNNTNKARKSIGTLKYDPLATTGGKSRKARKSRNTRKFIK